MTVLASSAFYRSPRSPRATATLRMISSTENEGQRTIGPVLALGRKSQMKTTALLTSLFLALAVSPAFGNSIVHLPNQAGFVWINNYIVTGGPDPGSHWMIFGEAVPVHHGYNYSFDVGDSTDGIHFAKGSFYDALATAAGTTIYLGTLYHSVFDVESSTLKGVFAGYEEMLKPNGSLVSSVKIHGTFVESLSFPNGIASGALTYGNLGIGNLSISSTPEPGTLAMMGTGLLGIVGVLRRRMACRKLARREPGKD